MYENVVKPIGKLSKATRIYPAGLCKCLYTPWENVLTWPTINPETGGIDDDIELKPGTVLYTAELNKQTQSFDEETQKGSAGTSRPMEINATLPGNTEENILILDTMMYHKFLVVFEERDGIFRFFGNQDSGADLSFKYTSGDNSKSRNRNIKFSWAHSNSAPVYKGSLSLIPITGGTLMAIAAFKVKDAGTPMITGDDEYDNALLENKTAMVFQDGRLLPPLVNDIDTEQYVTKDLVDTTIVWHNGGVNKDQIIQIFGS